MQSETQTLLTPTVKQFSHDVDKGLSQEPKSLPSKYFYDKKGDALFVKIMALPEYYLTSAELEIFQEQSGSIVTQLGLKKEESFDLIELGAGDGLKTRELLGHLTDNHYRFDYCPVDISQNALDGLTQSLSQEFPSLNIRACQGDYFEVLSDLAQNSNPKVILFMGSNLGNMSDERAREFMVQLSKSLNRGDRLILGVDLIKSEDIILPAYNDKQGITSQFNLNLLERINRELGGNFDLNQFRHAPEYSSETGIAKSFIVSKVDQEVRISKIGKVFAFKQGEKIHTEISRKYNDEIIREITQNTRLKIRAKLLDRRNYFADYVLFKE